MEDNIKLLYKKFVKIKEMGWIKTKRNGTAGVGYTFETLINKPEENFPLPDFEGIEIKTCRKYTRRNIHLFSVVPDGDFLFPTNRILYYLGYPDKIIKDIKIFNMDFNALKYKNIGLFKEGKIIVNYENKKIDFVARKIDGRPFKIDTSWSFKLLNDRLNLKLKYLARIIADVKTINGIEYFHYKEIKFYKLKGFNTFLSLIEKGYINIDFNIGVFRSGNRKGKIHDRGTTFTINDKYIKLLFDEIKLDLLDQEA